MTARDDLITMLDERITDVTLQEIHPHEGHTCMHFEGRVYGDDDRDNYVMVIALDGEFDYWDQLNSVDEDASGKTLASFDAWIAARSS